MLCFLGDGYIIVYISKACDQGMYRDMRDRYTVTEQARRRHIKWAMKQRRFRRRL